MLNDAAALFFGEGHCFDQFRVKLRASGGNDILFEAERGGEIEDFEPVAEHDGRNVGSKGQQVGMELKVDGGRQWAEPLDELLFVV